MDALTNSSTDNSILYSSGDGLQEGLIELGSQLPNPYSTSHMRQMASALGLNPQLINTTHKYVRLLPDSDAELDTIKRDTSIVFFDYPLDYEITKGGTYYHDPALNDDQITYQYAVVPVGYQFPSIVQADVLAELFLLDEYEWDSGSPITIEQWRDLECESFHYLELLDGSLGDCTNRSGWNPSGTIRVFDHVVDDFIPVVGCKVIARNWFTIKHDYTDVDGDYVISSFNNAVDYSIKWERAHFDVRDGNFGQAVTTGPNESESQWNLNISSHKSRNIATIFRAAFRYYYQDIDGLKRPGNLTNLKIAYKDKNKDFQGRCFGNWEGLGLMPEIQVFRSNDDGVIYPTNEIFSTTIHEIGHYSHVILMNGGLIQYAQVSKQLYESWANAIEHYVTRIEYVDKGVGGYDNPSIDPDFPNDHQQWWEEGLVEIDVNWEYYTPIYIDLIDYFNQDGEFGTSPDCPHGGVYDGANCYLGDIPSGESGFYYEGNFYYTPVGCCSCPLSGSWYDGANCFVATIPASASPFIYDDNFYYIPNYTSIYPKDHVAGYSMGSLESNVVKYSYGRSSLKQNLKAHKPSGVTDAQIDLYFDYYENL